MQQFNDYMLSGNMQRVRHHVRLSYPERESDDESGKTRTGHQQCDRNCFNIETSDSKGQAGGSRLLPEASDFANFAAAAKQPSIYANIFSWQTRVIRIWSSQDKNNPLRADLLTVDLIANEGVAITGTKQTVNFDALSYCWGDGPRERLLELNGTQFTISSNLQAAIQNYRSRTQARYLWVDAVCINQDDDGEKAAQVAMMLRIYQKASKVYAWLGEQSEDSDIAIASLDGHRSFLEHQLKATAHRDHDNSCIDRLQNIHSALCNFFARPWFRWTWIRQEAYGARRIHAYCGEKTIPLKSLLSGWKLLQKIEAFSTNVEWTHDTSIRLLLSDLSESIRGQDNRQAKSYRQLFDILSTSGNYQVSDQRDVVYASLGKSKPPSPYPLF